MANTILKHSMKWNFNLLRMVWMVLACGLPDHGLAEEAGDWLVDSRERQAAISVSSNQNEVTLSNGLIRRVFRLKPNGATVAFDNLMTGSSVIRSVKPEALISLDGKEYAIGGLAGQKEHAYLLPEWIGQFTGDPKAFQCTGFETGQTEAPFDWQRKRHHESRPWPPPGVSAVFYYEPPNNELKRLRVSVHYEWYDNLPAYCKWLTVSNGTAKPVNLDTFTSELIAAVEVESAVEEGNEKAWRLPLLHMESDYSSIVMASNRTTRWLPDPQYTSQVNYRLKTPALLVSRPPLGPHLVLKPGEQFRSFRTFVLVSDREDRERQGLAMRRLYRTVAPWVTENPIMMHVRNADTQTFRNAVDQCAEAGFEMIIYTFGSGLDMENLKPEYLARIKSDVGYAHAKGIEVGAYSLLASRRVSDEHDVINPLTGKTGGAIFDNSPCLGSTWAVDYFRKIRRFMEETGLDLLEHDGSYPGDVCASTNHPGHRGLLDSQWQQWRVITDFYAECRAKGIYLNIPDWYFLSGATKSAMGYRESNWSLPRANQVILGRQNIFDGTWEKTPSMGWMFVPLVEYQGGGAAATLEPLDQHRDTYGAHLANNLGAGVQACYRGPRLYDTDATKAVVKQWVGWFKQYRDILESDIIHVRRADGRDVDCLLHVNPRLDHCGLAVVYNPLDQAVEKNIRLPLYYTGLSEKARITDGEMHAAAYELNRRYEVDLPVKVPAKSMSWYLIEKP